MAHPPLYSWDVLSRSPGSVSGVTDDREQAFRNVLLELAGLPRGSKGTIRQVELSQIRPEYLDHGVIAEARKTKQGVSWVR